jgi:SAM-dependent methyltransferase
MAKTVSPEEILKMARGFMESRILHSAAELNLFTILSRTSLSAREVADKIGGDAQALSVLLDAVAAMGLLSKQGQTYQCNRSVSRHLAEDSEESILPMVLHMASLWNRWSRLTAIAEGAPVAKEKFHFSRNPDELRAFIGAMHVVGTPLAKQIAASVAAGSSKNLLDVGGGSGTYTIAFLRAFPKMTATLFDLPEVIEMARERLSRENLLNRANLVGGSFHRDELPSGHDLALISAIIHANSPEENLDLYRKAYRALNPGGRILVRDHVMEPDRIRPRSGAIFAINMLVGTSGGGTYTYEEIESGLSEAGFTRISLLRHGTNMDAVVEGYKP